MGEILLSHIWQRRNERLGILDRLDRDKASSSRGPVDFEDTWISRTRDQSLITMACEARVPPPATAPTPTHSEDRYPRFSAIWVCWVVLCYRQLSVVPYATGALVHPLVLPYSKEFIGRRRRFDVMQCLPLPLTFLELETDCCCCC